MWTESKQKAATREQTVKYGSKWIGHMVTDCSGLLRWALYQLGESIVHHARYQYTDYCNHKGRLINGIRDDGKPILPGTAVFLQGNEEHIHHVGVYVGDNTCIEAKGTIYGVVTSELTHWDHWGELKMVDYQNEEREPADAVLKAKVTNPNKWLNVRSGPGMNYPLVCQVENGTIVDVIAQEPEWWQIRSGGRIGWAFAQYLTALPEEDTQDQPPEQPEPPQPDLLERLTAIYNELGEVIRSIEKQGH